MLWTLTHTTRVALAEQRGDWRMFTLDTDLQACLLHGRHRFKIVPG